MTTAPFEIVCNALEDRGQWLEERSKGITGTVAPQLIGAHRFGSLLDTYLRLRGADDERIKATPDMMWGRDSQSAILKYLSNQLDMRIVESEDLLRSKKEPWMMYTLDAWAYHPERGRVPVEVKRSRHPAWCDKWKEEVPLDVRCQIQWGMLVTGSEVGLVGASLMGAPPVYEWVEWDSELANQLMSAGNRFWLDTQNGLPPEPDGSDSAGDAVDKLTSPLEDGKTVELGIDAVAIGEDIDEWSAQIKELEKKKKEAQQKIRLMLGDATFGTLPGGGRWKQSTTTRKGFVKVTGAHADLVAAKMGATNCIITEQAESTYTTLRRLKK